jgi:hypothetical protein
MVAKFENSSYADYDKYLEYRRQQKRKDRERVKNYLNSLATDCLFCGTTDDLCFHHVNPNEKDIDVVNTRSVKKAKEEASKCWCLCASCHNKLHQRLCDPLPTTYDTRIGV